MTPNSFVMEEAAQCKEERRLRPGRDMSSTEGDMRKERKVS